MPVREAEWSLLCFADGWDSLNTKDLSWLELLRANASEAEGLELLRGLDSLRRSTSAKQSSIKDGLDANHLERIQQYLCEVEHLIAKLSMGGSTTTTFVSHWSSPLSSRPSYHMFKLKGLAAEMGMASFQFGNALRAMACNLLSACSNQHSGSTAHEPAGAAASTSNGSTGPSTSFNAASEAGPGGGEAAAAAWACAAAEASSLFRRAAGVFVWLVERGLPRAAQELPADRPVELAISLSRVMTQVCLAEAQVVAACRAAQRGVSPSLVCSLHAGAWELWESAARLLKDNAGELAGVGERVRRFLATSSAVARARALRWLAVDLRERQHQAGQAEAACVVSSSLLASAKVAADGDASWRAVVAREGALTDATKAECEQARENVYYQTLAKSAPDLPPGKVLVTPIPFQPTQPPPLLPHSSTPGSPERLSAGGAGSAGVSAGSSPGQHSGQTAGRSLASALNDSLSLR